MAQSGKLMNEGARKAPFFFVWASVLVVGAGLVGVAAMLLPDVMADPASGLVKGVTRNCPLGTCRVSLVPQVFASGDSHSDVDRRLTEAGYDFDGNRYFNWETFAVPAPASSASLACDVVYYVAVEFDQDDRLVSAIGDPDAGCFSRPQANSSPHRARTNSAGDGLISRLLAEWQLPLVARSALGYQSSGPHPRPSCHSDDRTPSRLRVHAHPGRCAGL
jgi:hypothetical protein